MGDEIVLSWQVNDAFSADSCLAFFADFRKLLADKKEYFLHRYAVLPQFKAGAHCGRVTVAGLGEIKTEIAYHGDVLNTASQIQGLCNRFGKQFLISESVLSLLHESNRANTVFVTEEALRGKDHTTRVFSVE